MSVTPFIPDFLPVESQNDLWGNFGGATAMAASLIGRLSGMMDATSKADVFWLMWLLKESQYSNEIEGTVTTLDEVLENHAGFQIPVDRRDDVAEVVNYRNAMHDGCDAINSGMPFSLMLVRSLHAELLKGVRGADKNPGAFRTGQVHIGKKGTPVEEASYIPPAPEMLPGLLENWIAFANRTDIDPVIQAAVMHAQFEMIHPFSDGNGRMGRLLISLFFLSKGMMTRPCLYLSAYLHEHRDTYYSLLKGISAAGSWHEWIEFFTGAIIERCLTSIDTLKQMTALYESIKAGLPKISSSSRAVKMIDYAFENPVFTITGMAGYCGITPQSLMPTAKKLRDAGIFDQITTGAGRQPGKWQFTELINLLKNS